MCGNGQEHHKTPLFHQICTLIRKSPWYLTIFTTCRHRPRAVWKWSILSVFYYRSWVECVGMVRSTTKRHFFHQICTLIRKSPWYLTILQTCRRRPQAVWKWSILGVFYYRSWLECVAVVRSITKRHFFHQNRTSQAVSDHISHATVRVRASSPAWR